ncbi:MAG TPA: TadE/TadG family type IV pilus assembly protein [Bryobacteraceae bacterium]|nr:TadE/TadG family type IV pilus assembly protein [Bryobacteraceae bacterium]
MKIAASQARKDSQRGNAMLETSAIILLLLGLLFLVVDLSLALFTKATLQEAVKAGVRFAVTDQLASGQSYMNDSIVQVVQQNAMGMLNGSNGACKIAINYYNPTTGAASTGTGGDVIEVSVTGYSYTPIGILKSASPISITASSSDVLESCPLGGCPPVANPTPPACP